MKKVAIYTAFISLMSFFLAIVSLKFVDKNDLKNWNVELDFGDDVSPELLTDYEAEKTFEFSAKDRLHLSVPKGKVILHPSATNQITVRVKGKVDQSKPFSIDEYIERKGNTIRVNLFGAESSKAKFGWLSFNTNISSVMPGEVAIDIEVPTNFDRLEVTGLSLDAEIRGLNLRIAELNSVDGNLSVESVASEKFEAKSVSGNIGLNNVSSNKFIIATVSGDMSFKSSAPDKYEIDFESLSGEIIGADQFRGKSTRTIEIDSVSGNVEFVR